MKSSNKLTNQTSIYLLRLTIFGFTMIGALIAIFLLPIIYRDWSNEFPDFSFMRLPLLVGLSIAAAAFFTALYHANKILSYIANGTAFAERTVDALGAIKICAFVVSGAFVLNMPAAYFVAEDDDAPGLIVIAFAFTAAPFIIAVFAAVMQQLLMNVIRIKSENDLTV